MIWIGNAQDIADEWTITPANVGIGDVFKVTINGKTVSYTALDDTVADVTAGLLTELEASDIPEFQQFTYSDETTHVLMVANEKGVPHTVTASATNAGSSDVEVTTIQIGSPAQNEKQYIRFAGTPTGGTFTLSWNGATTAAIDYDADAADISFAASGAGWADWSVSGSAGGPWTVEFVGTLAGQNWQTITGNGSGLTGAATITHQTVTQGAAQVDEIQLLGVSGTGTYVLTITHPTLPTVSTGSIPSTASAIAIQSAIISAIAPYGGGCTVAATETAATFSVRFRYAYGGANLDLMEAGAATGDVTVQVAASQDGATNGTNEVQRVTLNGSPTGGTFTLTFEGQTTAGIAYNATKYAVRSALVALSNVAGTSEVQTLTQTGSPTGGTFTLTYGGQTTSAIAYNASAATIQAALEALSSIGSGNVTCGGGAINAAPVTVTFANDLAFAAVALMTATNTGLTGGSSPAVTPSETTPGVNGDVTVTGSAGGPWTVTFTETLGASDRQQMTSSAASLTGCAVQVVTTQEAAAAVNEKQLIDLINSPTGGTFTLTYSGQTTAAIAYDAAASAVDSALTALSNIGANDVAVTGDAGGPWTVEFTDTLAGTNVVEMTGNGASLTGGTSQTLTASNSVVATGKHFLNNTANWSTGSLPVNSDTVIFQDSDIDCLYQLEALTAVTVTNLYVYQSFTGKIGLPRWNENDYVEYRPRKLAMGMTNVYIGDGEGAGSGRINLNSQTTQTTIIQNNSGQPVDDELPAVQWIGTHASNAARINRGSFGAAVIQGEAATLATLTVAFISTIDDDADVMIGSGVTLATVVQNGGTLEINCAVATSLTAQAGETILKGTGAVAQLTLNADAYCYYSTSGTLGGATKVNGNAKLDFSQDTRGKTVTNAIDVYGIDADVIDPHKVTGSVVVDFNGIGHGKTLNLGNDLRVTRGATA